MLHRFVTAMFLILTFVWSYPIEGMPCFDAEYRCETPRTGFHVYAEYLLWKPEQDQMQFVAVGDLGLTLNGSTIPSGNHKIKIIEPSFRYHSGCRLGGGYQMPCTNWDFQVAWTNLFDTVTTHASTKGKVIPITEIIGILANTNGSLGHKAKSIWHFGYNTVDFEVGGSYALLSNVIMRPYFGAKVAQIRQKQNVKIHGTLTNQHIPLILKTTKKNDFSGIGPSIGVDASWRFCSQWSLFGGISGSLLYGKIDSSIKPAATIGPKVISLDLKDHKKNRLRPNVNLQLGLDWDYSCYCDGFQVKLAVAYEMQYWWNQWQCPGSAAGAITTGGRSSQGDLKLQGFSASVEVLF